MNDQFDQWLRANFPNPRPSEFRTETQLAILKERLRVRAEERRRKRIRTMMIVVPFLVLTGMLGSVVELGSDGFDHSRVQVEGIPGEVIITGFRKDAMNQPFGTLDGEIRELEELVVRNSGNVVEIEGISIEGHVVWLVNKAQNLNGETKMTSGFSSNPPSEPTREYLDFLTEEWGEKKARIESGEIHPGGIGQVSIDEVIYAVTYWEFTSDKYGEIVYYWGSASR